MTVLWVQWPNKSNLLRMGDVHGAHAVQVDDHYFNNPPIPLVSLKKQLGNKQLWCSFQPGQWNYSTARTCDHSDIQLYRQTCENTIFNTYRLGILGNPNVAISTYHSGDKRDDRLVNCITRRAKPYGNSVFVFKWANNEELVKYFLKFISR